MLYVQDIPLTLERIQEIYMFWERVLVGCVCMHVCMCACIICALVLVGSGIFPTKTNTHVLGYIYSIIITCSGACDND